MILWLLWGCYDDPALTDSGCGCPDDTGTVTAGDSGGTPDTGTVQLSVEVGTDAAVAVLQAEGGLGSQGAFVGPGDLDGDGFGELWVGVPSASSLDFEGSGAAWLVSGPVTGTVTSDGVASLLYGAAEGDQLGLRVGGGGDFDGDGRPDLWVSAPEARSGQGEVYVFRGGQVPGGILSPDDANAEIGGDAQTGAWRSAGNGDVDGDGVDDLLVGAVRVQQGEATPWWLFYGPLTGRKNLGDGTAVRSVQVTDETWDNPYEAAGIGELTGDGYAEVVLADHTSILSAGRIQIYEGSEAGLSRTVAIVLGATALDHMGRDGALDLPGDVDGDGFEDLVVGAAESDGVSVDGGAAWVLYGPLSGVYSLAAHGERLDGAVTGEGAGSWVAAGGDVDRDGLADVVVGGASGAWVLTGPVVAGGVGQASWLLSDSTPYAAGVGDLDGDGASDLAALGSGQAGLWVYTGL